MMRRTFAFLLVILLAVRAETHHLELCLSGLSEHIKSDLSLYRAVAAHDVGLDSKIVNAIYQSIFSQVPGMLQTRRAIERTRPVKHRHSALFVIISSDMAYTKNMFDRVHQATWSSYRRQFLVISNNISPKEILAYAWSKGFVDVTFLRPNFAIVYQFNPFKNEHTRLKCNSTTTWFPEKMKNLFGYRIRTDVVDDPPLCNVKRNASGQIVAREGAENKIFDLIAEKLNFRPHFLPRIQNNSIEDYRTVSFLREVHADELLENVYLGKAEMVVNNRVCPFAYETELNYTCCATVFYVAICPLVPVIYRKSSMNDSFFIAAGCIIFIILADFLFTRCCRFDRNFWNFLVIVKLVLGFSERNQPKKLSEKIVYVYLIVASISYMARMFDQLTKINMNTLEKVPLAGIIDIINYKLQPQADREMTPKYMKLFATDESGREKTIKIHQWLSRFDCFQKLCTYQNVSCLTGDVIGRLTVSRARKFYNRPKIEQLYDCPWYGRSKIIMKRGSPYIRPFNRIIRRMRDNGITNWLIRCDVFQLNLKDNATDGSEYRDLHETIVDLSFWQYFGLAATLIAVTVFFLEIIIARCSDF